MDRDETLIRDLGAQIAAAFGYGNDGADALRFYLMYQTCLPARQVLAMRPHELLRAYDGLGHVVSGSDRLH